MLRSSDVVRGQGAGSREQGAAGNGGLTLCPVSTSRANGVSRRDLFAAVLAISILALAPTPGAGQSTGTIVGTVTATDGGPLNGATVVIEGTDLATFTDARGRFTLSGVPVGRHQVAAGRLGHQQQIEPVDVGAAGIAEVSFQLEPEALLIPAVVVSVTREAQRLSETAATIGVITADELQAAKPTHPAAVMAQIPGVWVSTTGGEGHMTSIRQPQTTQPVYLFLEDGVPTRSTGFFNHNALYEVNLPQAERVEVLKGPATALYGSDAIGGVINVETRRPDRDPSLELYAEGGAFGYGRLLASASDGWDSGGLRADLNLTRTDGWRDATGYDRQSATLRWDAYPTGRASIRTAVTASRIHQQTAGSSALSRDAYETDPRSNITPISRRDVRAVRFSTAGELRGERTLLTVTPFARWNEMEMIPNWSLTYDPTISTSGHASAGLLLRVRRDLDWLNGRVIVGADLDHSPGDRIEHRIVATRNDGVFTDYGLDDVIYDYDVTFNGASPYVQLNFSPINALHVMAGLRYDRFGYSYRSRLGPLDEGRWRRPRDADVSYDHLSPKLGASYEFGRALNVYGNYAHGFRAPSEGQLFRQGSSANTLELEPVTADSYEAGVRGELFGRLGYSAAVYRMSVENDILSYVQSDGTPEVQNAGETRHRGFEAGLNLVLPEGLRAALSYSRAKHSYVSWSPRPDVDYAGNEMDSAPRTVLNSRLSYAPTFFSDANFAIEWNRLGRYWLDPENSHRYAGHDLFNFHANVPLATDLEVVGRVMNVTDVRYAETASFTEARGEELAPGMPRTVYLGLQYLWRR